MKRFILSILVSLGSAEANDWSRGLSILEKGLDPEALVCHVPDQQEPRPWCDDFKTFACTGIELSGMEERLQGLRDTFQRNYESVLGDPYADNANPWATALISTEQRIYSSAGMTQLGVNGAFRDVQTSLAELVGMTPGLGPEEVSDMRSRIGGVRLLSTAGYINELTGHLMIASAGSLRPANTRRGAMVSYHEACQVDGLSINAFYSPQMRAVVLCPGLVFFLNEMFPTDRQAREDALAFVLAHELGHSIDSNLLPKTYEVMKECIDQNFRYSSADPGTIGQKVGEITSDHWALGFLARRLSTRGLYQMGAAEAMAKASRIFCGTQEGRAHLRDDSRMNQFFVRNPDMGRLMGCGEPVLIRQTCTLEGRLPPVRVAP